jgi:hypothetical protein
MTELPPVELVSQIALVHLPWCSSLSRTLPANRFRCSAGHTGNRIISRYGRRQRLLLSRPNGRSNRVCILSRLGRRGGSCSLENFARNKLKALASRPRARYFVRHSRRPRVFLYRFGERRSPIGQQRRAILPAGGFPFFPQSERALRG